MGLDPSISFEEASSNGPFHSDFVLGKYPRHPRNFCTFTFKISPEVLSRLCKDFCFFTCVLVFLFLFSVFLTWLANCICCILLKRAPFMFNKYYQGSFISKTSLILLISLLLVAKKHGGSIPQTKS